MDFQLKRLFDPTRPDAPRVSVRGLPAIIRKGATAAGADLYELPDDIPAVVQFVVRFPRTDVMLEVAARIFRALGANVSLQGPRSVTIDIEHAAVKEPVQQQCTVFCPRSGESKSGLAVCIDCTDGRHTVRICC